MSCGNSQCQWSSGKFHAERARLHEQRALDQRDTEERGGAEKSQSDDSVAAREAFAQAVKIVNSIAANVEEEKLRETFLNSAALQELQNGIAQSSQ